MFASVCFKLTRTPLIQKFKDMINHVILLGRIDIILPDDLEVRFRDHVYHIYGYKKGNLTKGIIKSLELWIAHWHIEEFMRKYF